MKAIIVEDEVLIQKSLVSLLQKYCSGIEILGCAGSIEQGQELIRSSKPELLFLDIQLQDGTSFELLRNVGDFSFQTIFITAFAQYAIKAIKFNALDYLLKPLDVDELIAAVEKAKNIYTKYPYNHALETFVNNEQLHAKDKRITLPTSNSLEFVKVSIIIRCQAQGSYTLFVTSEKGNILVSKHIKTYEELLLDFDFIRPHQSHLINRDHIHRYIKTDGGYVIMSDGSKAAVSKHRKAQFLDWLVK